MNKIFLLIVIFVNLSCESSYKKKLGNGYIYDFDPVISHERCIFGPFENTYTIEGDVLKYGFDENFIIALQKPGSNYFEEYTKQINCKKSREFLKLSKLRFFWIVNKRNDSVYGPYSKIEFIKKKQELGVSRYLTFEN